MLIQLTLNNKYYEIRPGAKNAFILQNYRSQFTINILYDT